MDQNNLEWWKLAFICAAGLFSILGSIFNWNFFFEYGKSRIITKIIGRKGARLFYMGLGIVLLFLTYKLNAEH